MTDRPRSRFFTSDDGLKLHYLDFVPPGVSRPTPVVCLPGLTRGAGDFERLGCALAFASASPRRVVAFEYRGRGQSAHAPDWHQYDLATERGDLLKGLADAGIDHAHLLGTSRGGLHIMALAPTHRDLFASVILNDIGPRLEAAGLLRIKGYVGLMNTPRSLDEAIKLLKIGNGIQFDGLTQDEWRWFATTTFGVDEQQLGLRYDPDLARTLEAFDLDRPLPESWDLFDALRGLPLLTIRGANSDLLSAETLAAMGRRWPGCETLVVPGQGHPALLADARSIAHVEDFLARADALAPALHPNYADRTVRN